MIRIYKDGLTEWDSLYRCGRSEYMHDSRWAWDAEWIIGRGLQGGVCF